MTIRFRLLRFRTKLVLTISILFILVWISSFLVGIHANTSRVSYMLGAGGVGFHCFMNTQVWNEAIDDAGPQAIRWLPWYITKQHITLSMFIPFWCIAPFVFIPTFLYWRKDGHPPPGHCQNCGYNLTGNVSGKCSECGQII